MFQDPEQYRRVQGVLKMLTGILGEKVKMSQRFGKAGYVVPVTEIMAGPVTVVQLKTKDSDGYTAVQIAYGDKKRATKPVLGHIKKADLGQIPKVLAEFKLENGDLPQAGTKLTVDQIFTAGDLVKVTGVSKGKGFAGVIKRWGFSGGPATHGQSDRLRAPGSIGQGTTPGRVFRGKKMPGRLGQEIVTIKNLQVIEVDAAKNLLVLAGSVPGARRSILKIEKTGVTKKSFEDYQKGQENTSAKVESENIEAEKEHQVIGGENAQES